MMRRTRAAWRQLGVQLSLLVALSLVVLRSGAPPARAAPSCLAESVCGLKKPLLLFVVDYSAGMNEPYTADLTRWQAAVWALKHLQWTDNGLLANHFMLGLIRHGHDPDPDAPGTPLPGDSTGLVDGTRLDVAPYDLVDPEHAFHECSNGEAIAAALDQLPPPADGIERWTRGGLERARDVLAQTAIDHPGDQRPAAVVLITSGPWTDVDGGAPLVPAAEDPALVAHELLTESGVPTFVVTLGDAVAAPFADALASTGGTGLPLPLVCPAHPSDAIEALVEPLAELAVDAPCGQALPRVMFLLDASSSMLNIAGGQQHGGPGQGAWDQVFEVLAGFDGIFAHEVAGERVEDLAFIGLSVFGGDQPAEQKVVVDYGPCQRDNLLWALHPVTSCEAGGCVDPWGAPPISWTFKDGSQIDPPGFAQKTISHMPRCDFHAALPKACVGSGTYTHLGLQLVAQNLAAYKLTCTEPTSLQPCTDATRFLNVLITDGQYNSTDAQVQAPLQQMYADGVITHVIGYGDLIDSQGVAASLAKLADWGSGGLLGPIKAHNQADLEVGLAAVFDAALADVAVDPCCDGACTFHPEPTTDEPDPVPETTWGEYCSWTDGGSSSSSSDETGSETGDDSESTGTTSPSTTQTSTSTSTSTSSSSGEADTSGSVGTPTTTHEPAPTGEGASGETSSSGEDASEPDGGCACATDTRQPVPGLLALLVTLLGRPRRTRRREDRQSYSG